MEQEVGANKQFMKIVVKFTRSNWWQETEKVTEPPNCADFFLAEKSGLSGVSIGPCTCPSYVIAFSSAVESGLNMTGCVMCTQVLACSQTESKFWSGMSRPCAETAKGSLQRRN